MPIVWSVPAILKAVGGVASLRRALAQAGQDVPDRATIYMWQARNRLPTNWSAPIVHVVLTQWPGIRIDTLLADKATLARPVPPPPFSPFDDPPDLEDAA
jgi:hypothetical protein